MVSRCHTPRTESTMDKLQEQLDRIEAKLDILISALAGDDEPVVIDLEGNEYEGERDDSQPL